MHLEAKRRLTGRSPHRTRRTLAGAQEGYLRRRPGWTNGQRQRDSRRGKDRAFVEQTRDISEYPGRAIWGWTTRVGRSVRGLNAESKSKLTQRHGSNHRHS
jgi:hypothetical protein